MGFALLGVSDRPACRDLRRNSSSVLNDPADGGHPNRMHLRVSIAERLPCPLPGRTPSRVPHLSWSKRSSRRQPGICVHLTGASPLLTNRPDPWVVATLPEPPG